MELKVRDLEKKLDDMYVNRKSEAGLLLEIEHLKDDNIRLLSMLKSTEEVSRQIKLKKCFLMYLNYLINSSSIKTLPT